MSDLLLTDDELIEITGKRRPSSQALALRGLGIHHKIRPDGKIIVSRAHFDEVMNTKSARRKKAEEPEPDWGAAA